MERRSLTGMIVLSYASFILLGLSESIMGPLWAASLQTYFRQPIDALGLILVTITTGYIIGSASSARLFERFSSAQVLMGSVLIGAVGRAGYALAPSWEVMVLLGLAAGFGTGLLDGAANIYFAAFFNERLMNWLHASFGVGSLLAPQLINGLVVGREEGWRALFWLLAGLFLLVGVIFWLTRRSWQPLPTHGGPRRPGSTRTLALPIVWIGVIVFMCYSGMEATAGNWGVGLFESRGTELVNANNWVSAYWLSFTVGRIFFGFIILRLNTAITIQTGLLAALVAMLVLAANVSAPVNGLAIVLFGFALSPMFALMISQTQARLGPLHAPTAIGLQVAAASIGGGLLPAAAGVLVRASGFEIVPLVLAGVTVAMLLMFWIRQQMRQDYRLKREAA